MAQQKSALVFVLKSLLPYSRENLMLSFKPGQFFAELEKTSGYSNKTLSTTFYRARKQGYVTGGTPLLTPYGQQKVLPFTATKLQGGGKLMVIFDIPSQQNYLRRIFRRRLKELGFVQVQQSVWMTDMDHRKAIKDAVKELALSQWVQTYEAAKI